MEKKCYNKVEICPPPNEWELLFPAEYCLVCSCGKTLLRHLQKVLEINHRRKMGCFFVLFSEDLEVSSPAISVKAPQPNPSRLLSIQRVFFSKLPMGFRCKTLIYLRGAVIPNLDLKAEYIYMCVYIYTYTYLSV